MVMYYCHLDSAFGETGKVLVFIPIAAIILFLVMYLLSDTAEQYLSPSLEHMTIKFKLSESLAGVTLLAFGNGAPDVLAAFAAVMAGSEIDLNSQSSLNTTLLAVAVLTGASAFVMSVVTYLIIYQNKPDQTVRVTSNFYTRDVIFEFITLGYLLFILTGLEYIDIWVSIGFLLIYVVYLGIVVT